MRYAAFWVSTLLLVAPPLSPATSGANDLDGAFGTVIRADAVVTKMQAVTAARGCDAPETEDLSFVVSWAEAEVQTAKGEILLDELVLRLRFAASYEAAQGAIMSMLGVEGEIVAGNERFTLVQDHVGEWFSRALFDPEGDTFAFVLPVRLEAADGESRNGILIFRCDGGLEACHSPTFGFDPVIAAAGRNPKVHELLESDR